MSDGLPTPYIQNHAINKKNKKKEKKKEKATRSEKIEEQIILRLFFFSLSFGVSDVCYLHFLDEKERKSEKEKERVNE